LDLQERFGRRFKIAYDPAYWHERPEFREAEAAWLMLIPCQHGDIGPWDEDHLLASTKTAGPVARALKALVDVRVHQDGTDGANMVFPVGRLDEVAALMKPRRRRVLSPEARQALIDRMAKYAFQPAVGIAPEALECVREALVDV
jgi:hypothetical protein